MGFNYTSYDLGPIVRPYEKGASFLYSPADEGMFSLTSDHEADTGLTKYIWGLAKDNITNLFTDEPKVSVKRAKDYYGIDIDEPMHQNRVEAKARVSLLNNEFDRKFSQLSEGKWTDVAGVVGGALSAALLDPLSMVVTVGVAGAAFKALTRAPRIVKLLSSGNRLTRFGKAFGTIGVVDAAVDVGLEEARMYGQEGRFLTPGEAAIQAVASAALGGLLTMGAISKLGQRIFANEVVDSATKKSILPDVKYNTDYITPTDFYNVEFVDTIPTGAKRVDAGTTKGFVETVLFDPGFQIEKHADTLVEMGIKPQNLPVLRETFDTLESISMGNSDVFDFVQNIDTVKLLSSNNIERDLTDALGAFKARQRKPLELPKLKDDIVDSLPLDAKRIDGGEEGRFTDLFDAEAQASIDHAIRLQSSPDMTLPFDVKGKKYHGVPVGILGNAKLEKEINKVLWPNVTDMTYGQKIELAKVLDNEGVRGIEPFIDLTTKDQQDVKSYFLSVQKYREYKDSSDELLEVGDLINSKNDLATAQRNKKQAKKTLDTLVARLKARTSTTKTKEGIKGIEHKTDDLSELINQQKQIKKELNEEPLLKETIEEFDVGSSLERIKKIKSRESPLKAYLRKKEEELNSNVVKFPGKADRKLKLEEPIEETFTKAVRKQEEARVNKPDGVSETEKFFERMHAKPKSKAKSKRVLELEEQVAKYDKQLKSVKSDDKMFELVGKRNELLWEIEDLVDGD